MKSFILFSFQVLHLSLLKLILIFLQFPLKSTGDIDKILQIVLDVCLCFSFLHKTLGDLAFLTGHCPCALRQAA